jgi:hypothetical protein
MISRPMHQMLQPFLLRSPGLYVTLCNSAGGGNSFTLVLDLMVYCSANVDLIHTVDLWVSGAGSQVDSSVLARSSLRLGLMSGLDGVGG